MQNLSEKLYLLFEKYNNLIRNQKISDDILEDVVDNIISPHGDDIKKFKNSFYVTIGEIYQLYEAPRIVSNTKYRLIENQKGLYAFDNDIRSQSEFIFNPFFNYDFNSLLSDPLLESPNNKLPDESEHKALDLKLVGARLITNNSLKRIIYALTRKNYKKYESIEEDVKFFENFIEETQNNPHIENFVNFILRKPAILAIILGYDGIEHEDLNVIKLLNRSKVFINDSELARVGNACHKLELPESKML